MFRNLCPIDRAFPVEIGKNRTMIESQLTETGVLVVRPSGPLTEDDFRQLAAEADPRIEAGGKLRGLLIDAENFPGWKDLAGFAAHFRFVRDHHRRISRIAFVSDSRFLSALPKLARHFVAAEPRHFDREDLEEAIRWLEGAPDPEPEEKAVRYSWFPGEDLVWVSVDGKITTEEYKVFLDWLGDVLGERSPVSFLIDIDDVEGAEPGAMLADLKFALTHLKDIRRIALVGDEEWIGKLAAMPNPFAFKIRAFGEESEEEAWEWAREAG